MSAQGENMTKFKDLEIGDTFDFIAPTGYNTFFNRCTKISARKYRWDNPPSQYLETRVGSANVEVYNVERRTK